MITPSNSFLHHLILLYPLLITRRKTQPSDPEVDGIISVIHLKIIGRGGGDFTIVARDRRLNLTKSIPRPPTSVATLSAKTFLDFIGGRDSYETTQFAGKIRLEGDKTWQ